MESLFTGAYLTACRELGMEVRMEEPGFRLVGGNDHFSRWVAKASEDADLGRDGRMMVPVFFDVKRHKTKVLVFLGWESMSLDVQYATTPRLIGCDWVGKPAGSHPPTEPPLVNFAGDQQVLATPAVAEVYVQHLLNRDEFRRHCDRYRTRSAILANLR
jgi:hypothetical protein